MISDDDVNAFSKQQENENTKKKMLYDLKIFREFLETCDEEREIENITPAELQAIIKKFVLAVRKKKRRQVCALVYQNFSAKYRPLSLKK